MGVSYALGSVSHPSQSEKMGSAFRAKNQGSDEGAPRIPNLRFLGKD